MLEMYRGQGEFEKGYQPELFQHRMTRVICYRFPKYFQQGEELFLSIAEWTWAQYVRQIEICTSKPRVAKCSAFKIEMAIEIWQDVNHQVWLKAQWNCLSVVHSVQ